MPKPDHRERKHKPLSGAIQVVKQLAMELDTMDVREENFIVTLLMRHCQARLGLDVLEKFGGAPPDNPGSCLTKFKTIAADLEGLSSTDNTFVVNCLQQAWQRRAAIEVEELQAAINDANKESVH